MRTRRVVLALSLVVLCASPGLASTIALNSETNYADLDFGLFQGGTALFIGGTSVGPEMTPPRGPSSYVTLGFDGATGPLESLIRHRNPPTMYDEYTYAAGGQLQIYVTFDLRDGRSRTMTLSGTLPSMYVRADDGTSEILIDPFRVSIDRVSARYFGWDPDSVMFSFDWLLADFSDNDFDEPSRLGRFFGDYSVTGTDVVPEPALLTLLPIGLGALAVRRRRAA